MEWEKILEVYERLPHFEEGAYIHTDIPLVYQYRNFESFWSIIQSDALWITNARFSNDDQEQRFGANLMKGLIDQKYESDLADILSDNYIACFCGKDDKLSQWRGYAAEGGVSMGFEFNVPCPFRILKNTAEASPQLVPENYRCLYAQPLPVCYIDPREPDENPEEYNEKSRTMLSFPMSAEVANPRDYQRYISSIKRKAPFVKHGGFREEDEWRMLFQNEDGILDPCIRYRKVKGSSVEIPYIVAYPGIPLANDRRCVVRVALSNSCVVKDLIDKLHKRLGHRIEIGTCRDPLGRQDKKDNFCFGCTRRVWQNRLNQQTKCRYKIGKSATYRFAIISRENRVIISQGKNQEEVFRQVYPVVQEFNEANGEKIKVWCEGHLPIRSITVGPCHNQLEMEEAIRHYCRHQYWLKDVEIKSSHIPFRPAL